MVLTTALVKSTIFFKLVPFQKNLQSFIFYLDAYHNDRSDRIEIAAADLDKMEKKTT